MTRVPYRIGWPPVVTSCRGLFVRQPFADFEHRRVADFQDATVQQVANRVFDHSFLHRSRMRVRRVGRLIVATSPSGSRSADACRRCGGLAQRRRISPIHRAALPVNAASKIAGSAAPS